MAKRVLALDTNGGMSYCVAPPEKRGIGRCNHSFHQEEGETASEFLSRVSQYMRVSDEKEKTHAELITEIVKENALSFNKDPEWNNQISPLISRYLRIGDQVCSGTCKQELVENETGDLVNKLTLQIEFQGENYSVDFGEVPYIKEDGTFSISGVDYRCLPVVSKNKVGYGQGYSKGEKYIWIYQESGNLAISIPVEGDKCKILGKFYDKSEIEEAIINPPFGDEKIDMLLSSIDHRIYNRFPNFGKKGWMKELEDNFSHDEINDLEWRRIYTYEDQALIEMELQLKRMGVTFRNSLTKDDKGPIFYQKNNTDNIKNMLLGRSNVQLAENINPLAAYSQAHKISLVGMGGYNKDDCPEELRLPGDSYRGISDPLDQSSGKGIGLNVFLKNADVIDGAIRPMPERNDLSLTDFVPYRKHNNPNRVSMATSQMRQAMTLVNGEDPRLLGDENSDKAWKSMKGANIGRNLKVVYLTGEKEWEDSARISESAAKSLSAIKTFNFSKDPKFKDGDYVEKGTFINGKKTKYSGTIKETKYGFEMKVEVPFKDGDKIAGRFGNKCTVGQIVPDEKMPKIWNSESGKYEPADIIMSPLSIGKRGNIGAIMETQGSMQSKDIIPVKLPDGKTVKANNGKQFIMRLNQVAREKKSAYGEQLDPNREAKNRFGEMESILLTTTENRRKVLKYLKNQNTNEEARLDSILKAIGVVRERV